MQMKLWTNKSSRQQVLSSDSENEDPDVEYTSNNLTDNFNDEDLVSHCSDILQASPRSYVGRKRLRNWSGCQDTPSFGGPTQENVRLTEQSFTDYTQRIHNSRPTLGGTGRDQGSSTTINNILGLLSVERDRGLIIRLTTKVKHQLLAKSVKST